MKSKIIKIIICSIFVMVTVYYIPIPARINKTLQGIQWGDTATDRIVKISIKGWKLNYLFRSNKMKGTLTIVPFDFEKTNDAVFEFQGEIFKFPGNKNIQYHTMARYSASLNRYTFADIYFGNNFESVLIINAEKKGLHYIASDKTLDEIDIIYDYFYTIVDIPPLYEIPVNEYTE